MCCPYSSVPYVSTILACGCWLVPACCTCVIVLGCGSRLCTHSIPVSVCVASKHEELRTFLRLRSLFRFSSHLFFFFPVFFFNKHVSCSFNRLVSCLFCVFVVDHTQCCESVMLSRSFLDFHLKHTSSLPILSTFVRNSSLRILRCHGWVCRPFRKVSWVRSLSSSPYRTYVTQTVFK